MTNLFQEATKRNISIEYTRALSNQSMSVYVYGNYYIAIDYSLMWATTQERVHLAHEIGHCLTGSFYDPHSSFDVRGKHEKRADKWAIKKLIPKDELSKAVKEGQTECWQLAEHFNVTCEFMAKAINYYKN